MKGALFAIATAAAVGVVSAHGHGGHGNHQMLHHKINEDLLDKRTGTEDENDNGTNCGCTTIYETIYGEPTLIFPSSTESCVSSSAAASSAGSTFVPTSSSCSESATAMISSSAPTVAVSSNSPVESSAVSSTSSCDESSPSPAPSPVGDYGYGNKEPSPSPPEAGDYDHGDHQHSSNLLADIVGGVGFGARSADGAIPGGLEPVISITSALSGNYGTCKGDKFAISYTPYADNGGCKTTDQVAADIEKIAAMGFCNLRLYSTDCNTLGAVTGPARKHGMHLILGIFISNTGIGGAQPQVDAIAQWAQWDMVDLIVVGNEAVFNGFVAPADLAGFIKSCRARFSGYKGMFTTAEPMNVMQEYASFICPAIDINGANIHPFFNAEFPAENAGAFVAGQLKQLKAVCQGKQAINLETGWPTAGSCNGKACPGVGQQAAAVNGIMKLAGKNSVLFSFVDDHWKAPGAFGAEQSWGLGAMMASPKK